MSASTPDHPPSAASARAALPVLGTYLKPLWPRALLMAALLLGSVGLNLLAPQVLRAFLDAATNHDVNVGVLVRLAGVFLGVSIAVQLLSAGATYAGADVGWAATNRLRADLARHLLGLDMSYHKDRTPGEMIERIDGDVTALSNFFSQFAVRVFGALLLLLGALVMFWREDWRLGLGISVFAVGTLFALNVARKPGVEPTRREREASARLFGFIEERLTGLDDVRALGAGHHTLNAFLRVQRDFYTRARAAWLARSTVWQLSFFLFTLAYAIVIASAVGLYAAGAITLGTAFLLYQYMTMIDEPINQLAQQLQDLQKAGASLIRVSEILALRSDLPGGERPVPVGALEVRFEHVQFAYGDASVLQDVHLTIPAGHTVGLLGRTGSGKTTLTRLLSRLYDPTSGAVILGGVDTRDADLHALRERVAVVTQDVQLFQASVRDNLTLFDPSLPDARITEALTEVGLDSWLAGLPEGLHSSLPAGSLSAGEAQLLAFARVLLRDPGLVILDEPSSRLDPATEAKLTAAMRRLTEGRTAIIIAHRLDTVARVDDILVLGEGRVLEFAPRARLAANPRSQYAALLRAGAHHAEEVLA
ncbi:ABC transporter ATP-binding protein [Deinococcus maricopensis]|uniref:Xenobiotic-transporting ATPase n=1 Tax=Deinococcus maricopensis (strain DSM 21211 / LMG 22137 / NRRL B-23946 / LB-34) TaxID=709986 RepID=E8U4L8_DEIML|nr:ABC transporter ATP-binding protein [Deinococcus maricopensis]ADV68883.1 Xenobiotic-transporting ATPase [Deinococcus maricopensis DSM 21211]